MARAPRKTKEDPSSSKVNGGGKVGKASTSKGASVKGSSSTSEATLIKGAKKFAKGDETAKELMPTKAKAIATKKAKKESEISKKAMAAAAAAVAQAAKEKLEKQKLDGDDSSSSPNSSFSSRESSPTTANGEHQTKTNGKTNGKANGKSTPKSNGKKKGKNGTSSSSPTSSAASPKSAKAGSVKSGKGTTKEGSESQTASSSSKRKRGDSTSSPKSNGQPSRKRGRPRGPDASVAVKKLKLEFRNSRRGVCLAVGQGDTGQLGLGENVMERTKPGLVKDLDNVVDIVAGGMHSICLTHDGIVWTFGCNDEGSLGRTISDDDEGFVPGKVEIPGKVVQITAGDSHSVCLTEEGKAYYWGTFRDSSGSFGLTPEGQIQRLPVPLAHHLTVKKISSGTDHIALLTTDGSLYTLGCAEQGQLGRVGERFTARGARRGLNLLLQPDRVHAKKRTLAYKDVWAGSYNTFALTTDGDILVCGLNNYNQLGIQNTNRPFFTLVKAESFTQNKWAQIALGQHHTLALDNDGKVYALGRNDYGRLGLGESEKDAKVPTLISTLADKKIVDVSCGTTVSFAVTESGECYSWGMGSNGQLAHEDDEDSWYPEPVIGKQLESRKVILASGGGQHTVLLAA